MCETHRSSGAGRGERVPSTARGSSGQGGSAVLDRPHPGETPHGHIAGLTSPETRALTSGPTETREPAKPAATVSREPAAPVVKAAPPVTPAPVPPVTAQSAPAAQTEKEDAAPALTGKRASVDAALRQAIADENLPGYRGKERENKEFRREPQARTLRALELVFTGRRLTDDESKGNRKSDTLQRIKRVLDSEYADLPRPEFLK